MGAVKTTSAVKPDTLSSIPRIHIMEAKNCLLKVVF